MEELRAFRRFLKQHTHLEELKELNLLGCGKSPRPWNVGTRVLCAPCLVCFPRCAIRLVLSCSGGRGREGCFKERAAKALCEASKYIFFLRYESGPVYRPTDRETVLSLKEVDGAEATRLRAIWTYWEGTVMNEAVAGEEGAEASEGEDESEAPAPM